MQGMQEYEDNHFDLCLTDFPYGVGVDYDGYEDSIDNLRRLIKISMPEILRISKRTLITCGQDNIWLYPKSDWVLAWINKAGANQNRWGFTCWHPVLAYGKDPYRQNNMGARPDIIENIEISEKNGHPCPKPIKFWIKLLMRGSVKETDKILDPFAGSGTTALACEKLGREYACFEQSKKYYDSAQKRLKEFRKQLKLNLH